MEPVILSWSISVSLGPGFSDLSEQLPSKRDFGFLSNIYALDCRFYSHILFLFLLVRLDLSVQLP